MRIYVYDGYKLVARIDDRDEESCVAAFDQGDDLSAVDYEYPDFDGGNSNCLRN